MPNRRIPAEWEPHSAIQITWPDEQTDWAYMLDEVEQCYIEIANAIVRFEPLIVLARDTKRVESLLAHISAERLHIIHAEYNDTWARDYSFLTVEVDKRPTLLDFQFNAWGLKFAANLDNTVNAQIYPHIAHLGAYESHKTIVLEGGSIESDGQGTILTTEHCLLAPNRNDYASRHDAEAMLGETLGAQTVVWLSNGQLDGDDTDGHIDTLARLAPENTIIYVACSDETDSHYASLLAMRRELEQLDFKLVALPLPSPIFDPEDGHRLPATYANFLFVNGGLIVPTYNVAEDEIALSTLREHFPNRQVVGVDCRALIRQHGSLHCATMQYFQK